MSNTASMADYWMAPWPGTEAMLLLAMAHVILEEKLYDAKFLEDWVNWRDFLDARAPAREKTFAAFLDELKKHYASFTPAAAEKECGVAAATIVEVARGIGNAKGAFASHV